jgi:uncharacterized membrane protein
MHTMLVVIFDTEAKAIEGKNELLQLDEEGCISVYDHAIVTKNGDGKTTVKKEDDAGPLGTLAGTELGSLIGLISGPIGLAVGAAVGALAGGTVDLRRVMIGEDFIADVTKELKPNRFAVVAEIQEDSTTLVDSSMASIGGIVFRRALSDVRHTLHEENIAAMQADLARMKAELAQAHADRRAKLQEKLNLLDSQIREQLRIAAERREEAELAEKAKAEALEEKADSQKDKAAETHLQDAVHK